VPDKHGKLDDVVLGLTTCRANKRGTAFFGATIGRFGNRLAGGAFELDGKRYQVPLNDGPNAAAWRRPGFRQARLWKAEPVKDEVGRRKLSYLSKDGEMGFPGNLTTEVTYRLNDNNELHIDYAASTDTPVLNLTNHSYFNLAGAGNGDILKHVASLHASHYTPVNAT
jgi:aldose 1-epimerase